MTDKKTAALKLALEALEEIHPGNMTPIAEEAWNKAITAIREALAEQPAEHRPQNCGTGFCSCIECPYVQPAQHEPVKACVTGQCPCKHECDSAQCCLYTSPPASIPWVGLTKEDRYTAIRPLYCDDATAAMAARHSNDEYEAIEAKLKEKNT